MELLWQLVYHRLLRMGNSTHSAFTLLVSRDASQSSDNLLILNFLPFLPERTADYTVFCYCLGFDWCQNKFLAEVVFSTGKESWCWTAMSLASGEMFAKKKQTKSATQCSRSCSFCELAVGTWGTFEGFPLWQSFSRDGWIRSWLLLQKNGFCLLSNKNRIISTEIAGEKQTNKQNNPYTPQKTHQELNDCILCKVVFFSNV